MTMLNRVSDIARMRAASDTALQPVRPVGTADDPDLEPGAIVRAQVVSAGPRGLFDVRIGERTFALRLPVKARRGDQLLLVVSAREPQLRFALADQGEAGASATRLSETAHFVTALLGHDDELPLAETARTRAPLLAAAGADGVEIATALRQALACSGIFYEAHQAEWVAGKRPLSELLHEPQAGLEPLPQYNARRANEVLPPRKDPPVHREALAIVRQQLDTLDTHCIAWSGMVWPGQPLEWQVSEHPARDRRAPEEPQWRTSLRLKLPRLGDVQASLGVSPNGVRITLLARNNAAAAAMNDACDALKRALHAAGVTPLDVTVRQHDQA